LLGLVTNGKPSQLTLESIPIDTSKYSLKVLSSPASSSSSTSFHVAFLIQNLKMNRRRQHLHTFCQSRISATAMLVVGLLLACSPALCAEAHSSTSSTPVSVSGVSSSCLGASSVDSAAFDASTERSGQDSCGLYMAESSIHGSGLGMYAGRALHTGWQLSYGDVVLQVADFEVNNKHRQWFHGNFSVTDEETWLFDDYFWNSRLTMGAFEGTSVHSILPGVGMLANSHPGLVNAVIRGPGRTADLHRGRDPGAGASTTYHNSRFEVKQDIEPGSEIFVDYGSQWFTSRANEIGTVPL
jgi:hypothetical protein